MVIQKQVHKIHEFTQRSNLSNSVE